MDEIRLLAIDVIYILYYAIVLWEIDEFRYASRKGNYQATSDVNYIIAIHVWFRSNTLNHVNAYTVIVKYKLQGNIVVEVRLFFILLFIAIRVSTRSTILFSGTLSSVRGGGLDLRSLWITVIVFELKDLSILSVYPLTSPFQSAISRNVYEIG